MLLSTFLSAEMSDLINHFVLSLSQLSRKRSRDFAIRIFVRREVLRKYFASGEIALQGDDISKHLRSMLRYQQLLLPPPPLRFDSSSPNLCGRCDIFCRFRCQTRHARHTGYLLDKGSQITIFVPSPPQKKKKNAAQKCLSLLRAPKNCSPFGDSHEFSRPKILSSGQTRIDPSNPDPEKKGK